MLRLIYTLALAALVGLAWLGAPQKAQAAFKVSINGMEFTDGDNDGTINVNLNSVLGTSFTNATLTATSNRLLSLDFGEITQTQVFLASSTSVTLTNLTIAVTDTDFQPALAPMFLRSSGTQINGLNTTGSSTFQSWLDTANNEFGIAGGTVTTTGLQNLAPASGASVSDDKTTGVGTLGSPYSLTNEFVFTGTINGGSSLLLQGSTSATAVPAPTGLLLLASAAPALGLGAFLRRRKVVAAKV